MTLALYLDDCAYSKPLRERLIAAGHRVIIPVDEGIREVDDHLHLAHVRREGLILLTKNPRDFVDLHDDLITRGESHPGIFLVYQDNDSTRDMTDSQIVRAIARVEEVFGEGGLVDQLVSLNQFRW